MCLVPKHSSIIFNSVQIKHAFTSILIIWIAGIFFSRFLQSIGTISMCVLFLLSNNWRESKKSYFKTMLGIAFFGIFVVYLLSYFNSENKIEYVNILKNKIPFLFIPLSLISVSYLEKKQVQLLNYFFVLCAFISSLWSYYYYLQNVELYTKLYIQGEVIPTIIHHISLAVLLCFAVLFLLDNLIHENTMIKKIINFLLLIWFIYFIHVLSVRTGIVLLYIGLFLFGVISFITYKKPIFALGLIILLFFSAYISYQKIPTIKSKIDYTYYGILLFKSSNDTANVVSDSRRFLSDKIGIEIIKKNRLTGVGTGDLKETMNTYYKQHYPLFKPDVYSHIHNQYLYTICGVGIISGGIFCLLLWLPFIQFIRGKKLLYSIMYVLLLLVMFWESFIESQLGSSIFLVVCCLGFVSEKET